MVWAKFPIAAGVMTCAACLTVAAAVPAMTSAVKDSQAGVDLAAVNYGNLDNFSAIPQYQILGSSNDPDEIAGALSALASLSGIPPLTIFALTGNTGALAALDNLSAIPVYQAIQGGDNDAFGDLASTSALPSLALIAAGDREGYYGLDSTNALQAFDQFAVDGNTDAFVPSDTNVGYAALSGLSSYRNFQATGDINQLAGIDAFSAIPALRVLFSGTATEAEIAAAQRSLASVSAIPEYQGQPVPDPDAPADPPADRSAATPADTSEAPAAAPQQLQRSAAAPIIAAAAAPAVEAAPADDSAPAPVAKKKTGSYSGNFSPAGLPVLFGSGGGKGSADNGMRGYSGVANGLRKALGMGPDKSSPSTGGDSAGGGDAG